MNKETFKAGDEVYCPSRGLSIYKLVEQKNTHYPVMLDGYCTYQANGRAAESIPTQSIFYATPENKQLLEALYKCEFESPKLKGSDLTRKLLSEGKHVLCRVNQASDFTAEKYNDIVIVRSFEGSLFRSLNGSWKHAVPCNDYANLPDGVLTLKSEQ